MKSKQSSIVGFNCSVTFKRFEANIIPLKNNILILLPFVVYTDQLSAIAIKRNKIIRRQLAIIRFDKAANSGEMGTPSEHINNYGC